MATRRTYSREFKIDAVQLVLEQGMTRRQVARDLGIDPASLRAWIKQFADDPERAFPGKGKPRDEELHRLRRELEEARMERDILKKAIGIFSQMPRK
jgi:transposase